VSLALYHNRQIFIRRKYYDILLQLTKVRIIFAFSCAVRRILFRQTFWSLTFPRLSGRLGRIFNFFFVCVCFTPPWNSTNAFIRVHIPRVYVSDIIFFFPLFIFTTEFHLHARKSQGCSSSSQRNGSEMWLRSNPGARSLRIRPWFNAPQGPRTPRHQPARCCYGLCDLKTWQTSATTTSGIQQAGVGLDGNVLCIYDPRVVVPATTLNIFYTRTHPHTHCG